MTNERRAARDCASAGAGAGCRRASELHRDPALWAWLVVLLLAMLPVKAAIGA
jgi:hypothetical protein